jgi:hypothetical protein
MHQLGRMNVPRRAHLELVGSHKLAVRDEAACAYGVSARARCVPRPLARASHQERRSAGRPTVQQGALCSGNGSVSQRHASMVHPAAPIAYGL